MDKSKHIGLVAGDKWLEPYEDAIRGRHDHALWKAAQLTGGSGRLSDFADGHLYYGLHKTADGWIFREWAPNATDMYIIGDKSGWEEKPLYKCQGPRYWELGAEAAQGRDGA